MTAKWTAGDPRPKDLVALYLWVGRLVALTFLWPVLALIMWSPLPLIGIPACLFFAWAFSVDIAYDPRYRKKDWEDR